jgi:hypothetical protein
VKIAYTLKSKDPLTLELLASRVETWNDLLEIVRNLPYGRNSNRKDLSLVWKEQKGTCSTKHAFLKHVGDLNAIPNIELILGMYKMTESNTRKIGTVLTRSGLDYIPEAHCYLKIEGHYFDFTSPNSDFNKIKNDILLEKEIQPQQVAKFKVNFHKTYLKGWIKTEKVPFNYNEIWNIREQCIANLTNN